MGLTKQNKTNRMKYIRSKMMTNQNLKTGCAGQSKISTFSFLFSAEVKRWTLSTFLYFFLLSLSLSIVRDANRRALTDPRKQLLRLETNPVDTALLSLRTVSPSYYS